MPTVQQIVSRYTQREVISKKSERKPLKHDYFEFLIDRSINAWKAFMLP